MSSGAFAQLLPIIVLLALMYLLFIRPARRRAQQVSTLQSALSVGDEVMLSSGIFGTVLSVDEQRVHVVIADGVTITVHRGAIAEIVRDVPADEAPADLTEAGGAALTTDATGTAGTVPEPDQSDRDTDDGTSTDTSRGAN